MPLIGVEDPSHREADKQRAGRYPAWVTLDEAKQQAYDNPKWSPWTYELLNAIMSEHQERGDAISSSALTASCPRGEIIGRKADYIGNLNSLYVPFRGTMVHRTMELYAHEQSIAEHRFFAELNGVPLSCAPDLLTTKVLYDYKVTENPPMYNSPWKGHTEQVQLNAFICRNATAWGYNSSPKETDFTPLPFDPREHPVTSVALVYMGPKVPKVLVVEKTGEYFDAGKMKKGKYPFVWNDGYIAKVFNQRIEMFVHGLEDYPAWPAGAEEVWGGEKGWQCPGPPLCYLPNCLAKRWPNGLTWENPSDATT